MLDSFPLITIAFSTPNKTTIPPKKSTQDVSNKEIFLTPRTEVSTPVHEPATTQENSTNVMAKSIGSSTGENDNTDNRTPKTISQNLFC